MILNHGSQEGNGLCIETVTDIPFPKVSSNQKTVLNWVLIQRDLEDFCPFSLLRSIARLQTALWTIGLLDYFQGKDTSMGLCPLMVPSRFLRKKGRLRILKAEQQRSSGVEMVCKSYPRLNLANFTEHVKLACIFPYIFHVKWCFRLYREQLLFYCYFFRFSKDHQIDTIFGREGCINVYLHTYVCLLRGEMPVCIAIHLCFLAT